MIKSRAIVLTGVLATLPVLTSCAHVGAVNVQNWSGADQQAWYRASQGSRLIPYAWLSALEDDSGAPFMRRDTALKYHYIPAAPGEAVQLPVGFAIDRNRHGAKLAETDLRWFSRQNGHEPWVGMNCAACHTAELIVNDQPVRVDGGPTMGDFQSFTDALRATLHATTDDPVRWGRFATKVLATPPDARGGSHDNPANRALLKTAFDRYLLRMDAIAALSRLQADDPEYGPGRLDAVGHILNKVAYLAKAPGQFTAPAGAPVSYPYLWNVPQHAQLQWNGIAPNKPIKIGGRRVIDAGALVRNAGEVIGVFADVEITPRAGIAKLAGFPSSLDVRNLGAMESQLNRLKSPPWPSKAPFDKNLAAIGDGLFRAHCAECHNELARDDLTSPAGEHMTPIWGQGGVGTDPWMACNAYSFRAKTGRLAGTPPTYIGNSATQGMGPVAETRSMLTATAIGALAGKKRQIIEVAATGLFDPFQRPTVVTAFVQSEQEDKPTRLAECQRAWADTGDAKPDRVLLQYKARPLNGIWATGPYLHNGSVRTLWELLLDPAKRSPSFNVGSRSLDIADVGYADEQTAGGWTFRTRDDAGQRIDGNDNRGHDYGNAHFSDADRRALVEYMKSL